MSLRFTQSPKPTLARRLAVHTRSRVHSPRPVRLILALFAALSAIVGGAQGLTRTITVDDVLKVERIDRAVLSPDGEWIAVVVQRGAVEGEVFGRTIYDLDPTRGDVWLISRRTGERRNITRGAGAAAGFWCATWSPDGSHLAMLSTAPAGVEPRGGDNVRLYVWDRATDSLARVSDRAVMTQTMGGSALYRLELRGGGEQSASVHRCSTEENAPFVWLDNGRLFAVMLPVGNISGLLDAHARPVRHAEEMRLKLRSGLEPTVSAVGSGLERISLAERSMSAELRILDVEDGGSETVSSVPIYPFRGDLTLSIAPDRRRIAVLATLGTIPPTRALAIPSIDDPWTVERRLGVAEMSSDGEVHWISLPSGARFPLDLYAWSANSQWIALSARESPGAASASLFIASADDSSIVELGPQTMSVGCTRPEAYHPSARPVHWIDDDRVLAQLAPCALQEGREQGPLRADWWLLRRDDAAVNLTQGAADVPTEVHRSADGAFFTLVDGELLRLDLASGTPGFVSAMRFAEGASIVLPEDDVGGASAILVASPASDDSRQVAWISLQSEPTMKASFMLPAGAQLLDFDPVEETALWRELTKRGSFVHATSVPAVRPRELLRLNGHLAQIDWGRTMIVEYDHADGQPLKAAVILPPGYEAGRRYPTIVWVYPGYQVEGPDDYWLNPHLAGIYNLYLYAARGYVVMVPSMPLRLQRARTEILAQLAGGVFPAVDRLVELGIADEDRLGLFGQSSGGYAVYGLIAQSTRFRTAVALAGLTNLIDYYTQFDPTSRGYQGIEHEKSANWLIAEAGALGLGVPPYEDYELYWRNSPLALVDRVETPLLMIHGEHDIRATLSHAESFFFSLYRQGKTARLVRYWGENHGLSLSPANVRSIYNETTEWFGRYLQNEHESTQNRDFR